jgi:hypothetical protein
MYSEDAVVTSSCIAPDLQLTLALFLVQMFGEVSARRLLYLAGLTGG